ncbi:uncharacterized protein METZ01_LOCUS364648, partial [marine metagenome]
MEIVYQSENNEIFSSKWSEYVSANSLSYRYLPLYIQYSIEYSENIIDNKSFIIMEDNQCVGICFLPLEKINNTLQISLANSFTVAPKSINNRIEKKIYQIIEQICTKESIEKIMFYIDPLSLDNKKFNTLLTFGFIDSSTTDGIINLTLEKDKLWTNLNKSYKPLINGIKKDANFEIMLFDKTCADYDIHESYRKLHKKCSGRRTRLKSTFDRQYEMILQDNALLIGLKYDKKFIGFNYFFHNNKTAIYASGADDPKFEGSKIAIYHPILWTAIEYYHNNKYQSLELSQPCGYNKVNG